MNISKGLALLVCFLLTLSHSYSQYIVDANTDNAPLTGGVGVGSIGDLRYCIEQANANPGSTITFAIPGAGPHTIVLNGQLNIISNTFINGASQSGQDRIILDGGSGGYNCFAVFPCCGQDPNGAVLESMVIKNFGSNGVSLDGATGITITDCFIGVDSDGITVAGNGANGIVLINGAGSSTIDNCRIIGNGTNGVDLTVSSSNTITGNVISANGSNGINLNACTGNTIQGNLIGTNPSGTADMGNGSNGINLVFGSNGNTIGGNTVSQRNVISGNDDSGVFCFQSDQNEFYGNYIGTDINATAIIRNDGHGILLHDGSDENIIGSPTSGARNIISGNGSSEFVHGIYIQLNSNNNIVQGNYIGVDVTGNNRLANTGNGISIAESCSGSVIGGDQVGEGNVISGNGFFDNLTPNLNSGISMVNLIENTTIEGNMIGVNPNGTIAIPNANYGIWANTIGGNVIIGSSDAGNIISSNGVYGFAGADQGIHLENVDDVEIYNNVIGLNAAGTMDYGNGAEGIFIIQSNNVTIGNATAGNTISGNDAEGIHISASTNITVRGNYIGTDVNGTIGNGSLGNALSGIKIDFASVGIVVGGSVTGEGNIVSGNGTVGLEGNGVLVYGGSDDAIVQGNIIGIDVNGTAYGNTLHGVNVEGSENVTIGGLTGTSGNIISNSGFHGIQFRDVNSGYAYGNYIGLGLTGSGDHGNGQNTSSSDKGSGILLLNAHNIEIGGTTNAHRNVISNNREMGIHTVAANNTLIQNNYIGVDATNTQSEGNYQGGVKIVGVNVGFGAAGFGSSVIENIIANSQNISVSNQGNGFGIAVVGNNTGDQNEIVRNSIYCNAGEGISLDLDVNESFGAGGAGNTGKSTPVKDVLNCSATETVGAAGSVEPFDEVHVYYNNLCGCEGEEYLGMTTAAADGSWSFTHPFAVADSSMVTVTATDVDNNTSQFSSCCIATAGTISGSGILCVGDDLTIDIQNHLGVSFVIQESSNGVSGWVNRAGPELAASSQFSFSPGLSTGQGYYRLIMSGNGSCSDTSNVISVNFEPGATLTDISPESDVCEGNTVTYTSNSTSSTGHSWVITGGTQLSGGTSNEIQVEWNTSGPTGTITVQEVTPGGCSSAEVTKDITINPKPVLDPISGLADLCEGTSGVSYDVVPSTYDTYTWDVTGGASLNSQGTASTTIDWGSSSGQVSVYATDNGCVGEAVQIAINVNSIPVVTGISGNTQPDCYESGVIYTVDPANSGSSYSWNVPNGASITSGASGPGNTQITVDFGQDNGNVSVTETNSGCTSAVAALAIDLQGCNLDANFMVDVDTICIGESVTFTDLSTGLPDTWDWNFGSGASPANESGQGPHTITYTTAGSKTITLVASSGAVDDTETKVDYVVVLDTVTTSPIVGATEVCPNSVESYEVDFNTGSTYQWSIPSEASIIGAQNENSITIDWGTTAGVVSVIETNSNGCPNVGQSIEVTLRDTLGEVGEISGPTTALCGGVSGSNYTFFIPEVDNATSYIWTIPSGAVINSGDGTNQIEVDFSAVTGNNLTIDVTPQGTCGVGETKSYDFDVIATVSPNVSIIPDKNNVCGTELITISALYQHGGLAPEFSWYINGVPDITGDEDEFSGIFQDGDSVTVILTSDASCTEYSQDTSNSIIINILDTPTAEAGPDQAVTDLPVNLSSEQYQLYTTSTGVIYQWTSSVNNQELDNAMPGSLMDSVFATPAEDVTTYYLTVTNLNGSCPVMDSMIVTIQYDIFIPSGFSPNNDGNNDMFQIHNIEKFPGNHVEVYNRWGSLIYEADGYGINTPFWDGTVNGQDMPMGTYYYIVSVEAGGGQQFAGPVTIIK